MRQVNDAGTFIHYRQRVSFEGDMMGQETWAIAALRSLFGRKGRRGEPKGHAVAGRELCRSSSPSLPIPPRQSLGLGGETSGPSRDPIDTARADGGFVDTCPDYMPNQSPR
ncbi:MAG: hypothetical protein ABI520_00280 [Caldimonas sp.]